MNRAGRAALVTRFEPPVTPPFQVSSMNVAFSRSDPLRRVLAFNANVKGAACGRPQPKMPADTKSADTPSGPPADVPFTHPP